MGRFFRACPRGLLGESIEMGDFAKQSFAFSTDSLLILPVILWKYTQHTRHTGSGGRLFHLSKLEPGFTLPRHSPGTCGAKRHSRLTVFCFSFGGFLSSRACAARFMDCFDIDNPIRG